MMIRGRHTTTTRALLHQSGMAAASLSLVGTKQQDVHLIVLVHGWMGNPDEMGYLKQALERQAQLWQSSSSSSSSSSSRSQPPPVVVVHSATSNHDRTFDGIAAGGTRLADEVNQLLEHYLKAQEKDTKTTGSHDNNHNKNNNNKTTTVSLSFVGNSLGGLYARYALSKIPYILPQPSPLAESFANPSQEVPANTTTNEQPQPPPPQGATPSIENVDATVTSTTTTVGDAAVSQPTPRVRPAVFCTTATPHLGVSQHTYIPLPRVAESVIAHLMQPTGRDLFRFTSTIQDLTLLDRFVQPLLAFEKRIAHANAYQTDFQVPTATAAFVNRQSQSLHTIVPSATSTTTTTSSNNNNNEQSASTTTKTSFGFSSNGETQDKDEYGADKFWQLTVDTVQQMDPCQCLASSKDSSSSTTESTATMINATEMAERLDAMGWRKTFWDVRSTLPSIPLPFPFPQQAVHATTATDDDNAQTTKTQQRSFYTSSELYQLYTSSDRIVLVPLGHTMLVANSKSSLNSWLHARGRPIMDWVARDLLHHILDEQ
ncbi:hypothetical protein ACA910_010225 [Epithemia clementina (nom. ined.)]